jgi:hypothetical protein
MRVIVGIVENDSGIIPDFKGVFLRRANYQPLTIPFKIDPKKEFNYEINDGKAMVPSLTYTVIDNANWPHEFKLINVFLDLNAQKLTAGQQYASTGNQRPAVEPIDYPEFHFEFQFNNSFKAQSSIDEIKTEQKKDNLGVLIDYIKTDDLLWDFGYVEILIDKLEDQEIESLMKLKI